MDEALADAFREETRKMLLNAFEVCRLLCNVASSMKPSPCNILSRSHVDVWLTIQAPVIDYFTTRPPI